MIMVLGGQENGEAICQIVFNAEFVLEINLDQFIGKLTNA